MDVEPVIPAPLDDDDDDVAWALQTAAVQWQRGAHADAVVWIRRAVDAAIACGNARRTSDLTRLAADVADRIVARVSEIPEASESVPPEGSDVDGLLGQAPVAPRPAPPRRAAQTLSNEIPFEFDADLVDDDVEDVHESVRPPSNTSSAGAGAVSDARAFLPGDAEHHDDVDGDEDGNQPTLPPGPRGDLEHVVSSADVWSVPPASGHEHSVHPDEIFSSPPASAEDDSPFDGPTQPISGDALDALDRSITESVLGSTEGSARPRPLIDGSPPLGMARAPDAHGHEHEQEHEVEEPTEELVLSPGIAALAQDVRKVPSTDDESLRPEAPSPPGEPPPAEAPRAEATSEVGLPVVAGVALDSVRGFEDLPEEAQLALARSASLTTLAADEEVGAFGAALVASGKVGLMPSIADVAASVAGAGEIVFTRGTLADGVPLRVVALQNDTVVATWSAAELDRTMADCPWVADELRLVADRFQALAGATLGPLGDRLDDALRGQVLSRLEVKAFSAGEVIVAAGKAVPGLHVVGGGKVELGDGLSAEEAGPGDILFAAEVLGAGLAMASARAGSGGALILFASRGVAHELLLEVPPLIEILAG